MQHKLEQAIGVLNGAIGDYLHRTQNGLATPMRCIRGEPPAAQQDRLAVLVHGLMSTEHFWLMPDGQTYGSLLARDLGYAPVFVRYNSGLHISDNGERLDELLEELVRSHPVPVTELLLIGHSMGGLILRSAAHAAAARERRWLGLVQRAFYLGTPHLGAPLERAANLLTFALAAIGNPYTRLVADIVNLRSSGVKDLRYGNLRGDDWLGAQADALLTNGRHPVPLLPHIRHHLIAGVIPRDPRLALLFGDALVPVRSATGRSRAADRCAPFPQEHVRVLPGLTHLDLAHDPRVYALIRAWSEEVP